MRPNIDDHDYETKMKKVHSFIGDGDKVKITLRFRGRELSHQQLGMALLQRVAEDTTEDAKRSEEHTPELQSLRRISYAVFCLKKTEHRTELSQHQNRQRE